MFTNVLNAGKDIANKIGNKIMNLSEIEAKIKEVTNDDPWGPQCSIMQEIAEETFSSMNFNEIMNFIWYRIFTERPLNSKRTYKGLILLSYMLLNGSDFVALRSKDHIDDLRRLDKFSDTNGTLNISIRKKSGDICDLLSNPQRLQSEREKAKNNQLKVYNKQSSLTTDGLEINRSNVMKTSLGDFDSWQPISKSIPVVIGESFINLVNTLTQNISGPPPTETHDNFELPSYYSMKLQLERKKEAQSSHLTIGTLPKDDNTIKQKISSERIEDIPIIDFSESATTDCNRTQEEDFGDFHCWDSPVPTISERPVAMDFFPDFDSLARSQRKPSNTRSSDHCENKSQKVGLEPSKTDLKLGSTWNDIGNLKIDLDNVCGSRRLMYSKS